MAGASHSSRRGTDYAPRIPIRHLLIYSQKWIFDDSAYKDPTGGGKPVFHVKHGAVNELGRSIYILLVLRQRYASSGRQAWDESRMASAKPKDS